MKLNTRFGQYGGTYAPESLIPILSEVEQGFIEIQHDKTYQARLRDLERHYAGRSTPITYAERLSKTLKRDLYLKREDLLHGGAHKTNNCLGQLLLAAYLGKKRIIAETGAGMHGVATAMIGAKLGMDVTVYMGALDVARQAPNVARMKLFGAKVVSVESGGATLKDAVNEALRDWIAHPNDTYYCFGTAAGPHPFPTLVRYFQSVIGREARQQMQEQTGGLPDAVFACIGGGSNAIGMFSGFLEDASVRLYAAEAAGKGLDTPYYAATIQKGTSAVFHGMHSLFLQDEDGQIMEPHSISAGLDYPGIGPEHAYLHEIGRVTYLSATDDDALDAFARLAKEEGIIPAFESAHALSLALRVAPELPEGSKLLVNLSGRGDKDLDSYQQLRGAL